MAKAYYPVNGTFKEFTADMVNAAASNHTHTSTSLLYWGMNIIDSDKEDTPAYWGPKGFGYCWFTPDSNLTHNPSDWGWLLNIGGRGQETKQLWMSMPTGDIYQRGGNSAGGWNDGNGNGWYSLTTSYNPQVKISSSQPTNSEAVIWIQP